MMHTVEWTKRDDSMEIYHWSKPTFTLSNVFSETAALLGNRCMITRQSMVSSIQNETLIIHRSAYLINIAQSRKWHGWFYWNFNQRTLEKKSRKNNCYYLSWKLSVRCWAKKRKRNEGDHSFALVFMDSTERQTRSNSCQTLIHTLEWIYRDKETKHRWKMIKRKQ